MLDALVKLNIILAVLIACSLVVVLLTRCTPAQPVKAPDPICTSEAIALKYAECSVRVAQCEPEPAPCPALDECNQWADERMARCVE